MKKFGYFRTGDAQIGGIKYGNWGSRPYEYCWAATVEQIEGKDIFDFGTGLPSEHNWHEFVDSMNPKSYFGIDLDSRLKLEEINEENHKVLCLNGKDLPNKSDSIDLIFSISSFEHIDNIDDFKQIMKEMHRILRPGGKMVVTLDEFHDANRTDCLPWNELEKARIRAGITTPGRSYQMQDFANDISSLFTPCEPIETRKNGAVLDYLYSHEYNDIVSYGVFEVNK